MLKENTQTQIAIRCTQKEKDNLKQIAADKGFSSLSEYMLFVAKNAEITVSAKKSENKNDFTK